MTKQTEKPKVYDFDHEDGIASQMTEKQMAGFVEALVRLNRKVAKRELEDKKKPQGDKRS